MRCPDFALRLIALVHYTLDFGKPFSDGRSFSPTRQAGTQLELRLDSAYVTHGAGTRPTGSDRLRFAAAYVF